MISSIRKIYITIAVFGSIFVALISCAFLPLFNRVRGYSNDLERQKNALSILATQLSSLEDFNKKHHLYQEFLTKIENSFVDPTAPIDFMEFLELQAEKINLKINISALSPSSASSEPWLSTGLEVSLRGSFENCLRFLEELQNSTWLVDVLNLDIGKASDSSFQPGAFSPDDVYLRISLNVFSKEGPPK